MNNIPEGFVPLICIDSTLLLGFKNNERGFLIYSLLTQFYKLNDRVILLTINFVVQRHLQVYTI